MPTIIDPLQPLDDGAAAVSDAPAQAWLDRHVRRFGHFIGGRWVRATRHFDGLNPATGQRLAEVAQGTPALVERAVRAAEAALPLWQQLGGHGRASHLYALARALRDHARLFALLLTLERGQPIRVSRDVELPLAVRHFEHHAGWARLLAGAFPRHRPLGVVGQIVAGDAALLMLARKVAPALACGNTVVFKPAETTSLSALLFADVCAQVGLPQGVLNIVTGDGEVGAAMARHPRLAGIAFAGSADTARAIRSTTAGSGKRLVVEAAGSVPVLVFADADVDSAVEGLVDCAFVNRAYAGRAATRLLVHEGTAAALLGKLKARMGRIRVGNPLDPATDVGPLASRAQWARVSDWVEQARGRGGVVEQVDASAWSDEGLHFAPALVTLADTAGELGQHALPGPVLTVQTFRTPNEAVELANNSRFGLAAGVWSESIGLALDVASRLAAGVVWVNGAASFDAACGFGGCRDSGFGRDGGREGLLDHLQPVPAPARRAARGGRSPPGRVGDGNRDTIHRAVVAARGAASWERTSAPRRARVLFELAEQLAARLVGALAEAEVRAAADILFGAAARADTIDGAVHQPPLRGVTLALNEPLGVIGVIAPDALPLPGLLRLVAPAIALGNRVVAVPSSALTSIATELGALFERGGLPGGVFTLVCGPLDELADALAAHADVDALWWPDASPVQAARVEALSIGNLKRTWTDRPPAADGDPAGFDRAVRVKNVWIPFGV